MTKGRPNLAIAVAILAAIAATMGTFFVFCGIVVFPHTFNHSNSADFYGDTGFLITGLCCLYVAIRWFRAVPKIFSGK